jgi:hypothetical protein
VHIGGERIGSSVSVARLSLHHVGGDFVQGTLAEQVPQRLDLEALLRTEELCTDAFQTLHVWSASSQPFLALTEPSLAGGMPLALLDHSLKPPDAAMDTEVALLQTPVSTESVLQHFVTAGASATHLGSICKHVCSSVFRSLLDVLESQLRLASSGRDLTFAKDVELDGYSFPQLMQLVDRGVGSPIFVQRQAASLHRISCRLRCSVGLRCRFPPRCSSWPRLTSVSRCSACVRRVSGGRRLSV